MKTELLVDEKNSHKFITIDYWDSKEKYLEFINENRLQYDRIDKECNVYTLEEEKIGDYVITKD